MTSKLLFAIALLAAAPAHAATTVFVNRCAENCVFTQGIDDSVGNVSSVVGGTSNLSPFEHGDAAFEEVVACMRRVLAPFDLAVVTSDPSPAPHSEIVVAGSPQQAGLSNGVGGIAPFSCSLIENAPAFAFANVFENDPRLICEVAAAQVASLAGIEPLYDCRDITSYLPACGTRRFLDQATQCGIFSPSTCMCGGTTRNSFALMLAAYGGADPLFADGFE